MTSDGHTFIVLPFSLSLSLSLSLLAIARTKFKVGSRRGSTELLSLGLRETIRRAVGSTRTFASVTDRYARGGFLTSHR